MDTVAQFFTEIKNALRSGKEKVDLPSSNVRTSIAEILKQKNWIRDYRIADDGKQGLMRVYLHRKSRFSGEFIRVSKPGRRLYVGYADLPPVRSGKGFAIVSTNIGIIPDDVAREKKVGGELMVKVW